MLPKAVQVFVTQEMLETAVQLWFDGVKDLLDDGKLNNSTEEVQELNIEDKIMHKTELDDGTYKNYAKIHCRKQIAKIQRTRNKDRREIK